MVGLKVAAVIFMLLASRGTPRSTRAVSTTSNTYEHVARGVSRAVRTSRDSAVQVRSHTESGVAVGGSGAYVTHQGRHFILTAAHVVVGTPVAMVVSGEEVIMAKVVYLDEVTDIAVLRIEGMFSRQPLSWATSKPGIGEEVVYTGFPNGYQNVTIMGHVSGQSGGNMLLHSYAWSGASGSVILDQRGRIVGILSAVDVGTAFGPIPQVVEDVVIAVPISKLKIDRLIHLLDN